MLSHEEQRALLGHRSKGIKQRIAFADAGKGRLDDACRADLAG